MATSEQDALHVELVVVENHQGTAPSRVVALLLADAASAAVRIAGLAALTRAERSVKRVGLMTILVAHDDASLATVCAQLGSTDRVLIVEAGQLVHPPLFDSMVKVLERDGGEGMAVAPEAPAAPDVRPGRYAGACVLEARRLVGITSLIALREMIEATTTKGLVAFPHGAVARYPLRDAHDRREAHRLLYRVLTKSQDNAITRYLYRPVSLPLSVLLAKTPITPNQISYVTAIMVTIGLFFTARVETSSVWWGTLIVLAASYVDCCDGEVARLKLLSSKFGAWLDTIVDELSSVGYMLALGWHAHLRFGAQLGPWRWAAGGWDAWQWMMVLGAVTYAFSIFAVYYNIIVVVGSANSQDYIGEVRAEPCGPGVVCLKPASAKAIAVETWPAWARLIALILPNVIRRDFVSWASLLLAALALGHWAYLFMILGGFVTALIVGRDHVRLRLLTGRLRRDGLQIVQAG